MATHEHNGTLSYKDENGDIHKIYPKTKPGNISGLYESPALTGVPTAPTAEAGTNTTQLATTEFVQSAMSNVRVPTTDTITEGSTDALTSGGLYRYFHPKSGQSFVFSEDNFWAVGVNVMLQYNDVGLISMMQNSGIEISANKGVKLSGGASTYDSSATQGFRKSEISLIDTGFALNCTGKNTTIGDHGLNFYHAWAHDSVYAPMLYPKAKATTDLGCSYATWNNLYIANSPSVTSDRNQKKDINYLTADDADKIISKLKPCTYRFVDGTSGRIHNGLIAQDVEEALGELGISTNDFAAFIKSQKAEIDEDGKPKPIEGEYNYSLRYEEFISLLISECQYLKSRINDLESRLPVTE